MVVMVSLLALFSRKKNHGVSHFRLQLYHSIQIVKNYSSDCRPCVVCDHKRLEDGGVGSPSAACVTAASSRMIKAGQMAVGSPYKTHHGSVKCLTEQ